MVGEGDAKGRMKRHFSLIVFEKRQVKLLTVYHCAFFFSSMYLHLYKAH